MPEGALNTNARVFIKIDAANEVLMLGVWISFPLTRGGYSCQHLNGKFMLADEDSTIPKKELQSLLLGTNLGFLVVKYLGSWVVQKIVCAGSTIALSWDIS